MDLSTRPLHSFLNEDQRWIGPGGQEDTEVALAVTLNVALFDMVGAFPNRYIPSGVVLGKVTATGLYGPYGGAASGVQTVGLGAATAGTVTITFNGQTTAAIPFNATVAQVQAALNLLPNVLPGDIVVSGAAFPGVQTLSFGGRYLGLAEPAVTVTPTGLTGGAPVVTVTAAGGSPVADGRQTAAGLLMVSEPVDPLSTSFNHPAAMYWRGMVIQSYLPANNYLDAAAIAALSPKILFT